MSFWFCFLVYRKSFTFSSWNPNDPILDFGFRENETFRISVQSLRKDTFWLVLADSKPNYKNLSTRCHCSDGQLPQLNALGNSVVTWSGAIPHTGVYSLHVIACGSYPATYNISVEFSNSDSREDCLPRVYTVLACCYIALALLWLYNGIQFIHFRIPLHTIFSLLPIPRALGFVVAASNRSMPLLQALLRFVYYSTYLAGTAAAGAGFCTFRIQMRWPEKAEIAITSACVVAGVMMILSSENIHVALFFTVFVAFAVIWYLQYISVNLIVATRFMKAMKKRDAQIYAKIELARNVALSNLCVMLSTVMCYVCATQMKQPKVHRILIFEIGHIINIALQQKFLTFRKKYSGHGYPIQNNHKSNTQLRILIEPGNSLLVTQSPA